MELGYNNFEVITMKKKNFIIIISFLAIIMIGLIVLVIVRKNNNQTEEISEELRAAREVFDIKLSSDESEYIIYDLKNNSNIDGNTIIVPDSIDGIPVTKLIDKDLKNFSGYNNISSIQLGKNISYIGTTVNNTNSELLYGENIFSGARKLINISVSSENNVFSSENGVLYNKDKTILIKYPAGKVSLSSQANHTFNIPDTVEIVYQKAFYQNLTIETVNLGVNVKVINKEAFMGCEKLTQVKFNSKLEIIASKVFENCEMLEGVELLEGLTSIGYHAFYNCINLSNIYIPSSVVTIEASVFVGCSDLSKVYTAVDNVDNLKNILTDSKQSDIALKVVGK